ncbi:MAG TPA: response regulator [Kofleriaceae bacterium]|nr:response regulator [Kofleriaceae bacterium]
MSSRREALIARYRVLSLDRIRAIRGKLPEIVAGNAEALAEVRRELHTLKGDSHLLGLVMIGRVAHACEEQLLNPPSFEDATRAVARALEAVKIALRDETSERSVIDEQMQTVLAVLQAPPESAAPAAPAAAPPAAPAAPAAAAPAAKPAPATASPPGMPMIPPPPGATAPAPGLPVPGAPAIPTSASAPGLPAPAAPPTTAVAAPAPTGLDAGWGDAPAATEVPVATGAPAAESTVHKAPAEEPSRWVHVNAHDVDMVCERLSALHADLGRLHATLRVMLASARDTMHDVERLRADLDEIVSSAWALRLSPVHGTLSELGDYALELARSNGKELRVRIDDGGALVERHLLDEVREPLLHLVRNAVDHGIEPASERRGKPVPAELALSAEGRGDHVVISVADDGRGVDLAAVRQAAIARGLAEPASIISEETAHELLFVHGFSTRQGATDLSGRGVGLDAVRRRLLSIGGRVTVSSSPGAGTRFAIHIPSTVFRERVLIADVGGALCALPARDVEAVVPIGGGMIESVGNTSLLRYEGEGIPFLPMPMYRGDAESTRAAIVSHSGKRWAISLPDVVGDIEMLRVPVDASVAALGPFAASGTLDDGRLVLVVSLDALLAHPRRAADLMRSPTSQRGKRRVLVVDDSPIVRDLLTELLSSVGLDVRSAADGAQALQALNERTADLIVSDVEMPVMDGFELLRQLRDRPERIPVVMVTTRGTVSDRAMAAALGADALIVKSEFENAHLLETVKRFVEIGA